jgi:hypothetical protein
MKRGVHHLLTAFAELGGVVTVVSAVREARAHGKGGRLVIELRDENGKAITSRSRVDVRDGGRRYQGRGRSGEATLFTFELPPGDYVVHASADGFHRTDLGATVEQHRDIIQEISLAPEDRDGEEGEETIVTARFEDFQRRRFGVRGQLPTDGRAKALEHMRRMLDPEMVNAPLKVSSVKNPRPRSSLGCVESFVKVESRSGTKPEFERAIIAIPYAKEKLGWVDPRTMRVFEYDVRGRRFRLVPNSACDPDRQCVYAYIDGPGTFGLFGLPEHPAVLEAIRAFCTLDPDGTNAAGRERICQLILCEEDQVGALEPPGGSGSSACDFCREVTPPAGGLPECQILDETPSRMPPGPPPMATCSWLSVGPRNLNGRVRAMAIHPNNGNIVFAGTANAGVWSTTDAGVSWKPLMFQEGALEIGALALHLTDPANPMGDVTLYAGTGEPTSWPGYKGVGVLKSTTSGSPGSWAATGSIPSPGGDRFAAIAVDPSTVTANPATTTVYAGGPGGLYKSTNGGGTWNPVPIMGATKNIQGLALDPANPSIVYAAVAFEGIYKFDPATGTWSAFNNGLAGPFPQLILIAIGQSAPHKMYAKLDQTVYVYNNAMNTWQSLGNHGGNTYGYWNNVLAVDPQDSNIVFAGGIGFERTYDGGTNWQNPWPGHEDQHALVFDTSNHLNVFVGNDGGVFRGAYPTTMDTGTWTKRSDGLTITHLNSVGASAAATDLVGAGLQDNGTARTTGSLTWDSLPIGGDGSDFIIDPANPLIIYGQLTTVGINGRPYKSVDGGATFAPANNGFTPDGLFVGKMILDPGSPVEPNRVLFTAGGDNRVWRTTNSAGNWSASSPNLGSAATALAIAPTASAIVFAGTSSGLVWRSSDNGATVGGWKNVTVGTLAGSASLPARMVSDIVDDPTDPDTVFVGFAGFASAGSAGHVFKGTSSDGWATWKWQDITANLPNIPVNALEIDGATPGRMWAGTDVGVFQTTDGGLSWAPFINGLPNVVIQGLRLNAGGDRLRAAAYGFGLWEMELAASCPTVDVYVRDNKLDTGEAVALSDVPDPTIVGSIVNWWESVDLKVDAYPYYTPPPDGVEFDQTTHENPVRNDAAHPNPNRVYVQVHNRGPLPAHNVKVKILWADASAGLPSLPSDFWSTYPNAWTAASPWAPVDPAVPFQNIAELLPHTPKILSWNWVVPPTAAEHSCILTVISSDEDPVSRSDANPNDHLVWMVAPTDKHVALKNLTVVTAAPPPGGGAPLGVVIEFHNPFEFADYFDIIFDRGTLPNGGRISLLTPEIHTRAPVRGKPKEEGRIPIRRISAASGWWRKAQRLPKRGWKNEILLSQGIRTDPCSGRNIAEISGVLIAPGGKMRAALVIAVGGKKPRPGASYDCTLMQRHGEVIIGGITTQVRIPPAEVTVSKPV